MLPFFLHSCVPFCLVKDLKYNWTPVGDLYSQMYSLDNNLVAKYRPFSIHMSPLLSITIILAVVSM
jgi:hypothetical protein